MLHVRCWSPYVVASFAALSLAGCPPEKESASDGGAAAWCVGSEGQQVAVGDYGAWLPSDLAGAASDDGRERWAIEGGEVTDCSEVGATSGHRRCCCAAATAADGTRQTASCGDPRPARAPACVDDLGATVADCFAGEGCTGDFQQDRRYQLVPGSSTVFHAALENGYYALCDGGEDALGRRKDESNVPGHLRCRCISRSPDEQALRNPSTAGNWAEFAVTLLTDTGLCTGALIAPRVVLTAAHCLEYVDRDLSDSFHTVIVWAPFARGGPADGQGEGGGFSATAVGWEEVAPRQSQRGSAYWRPDLHDLALVYLSPASQLIANTYPSIATEPPDSRRLAYALGQPSDADPARGRFIVTSPDMRIGPLDGAGDRYWVLAGHDGQGLVEGGDSGGPVMLDGTTRILGVLSADARVGPTAVFYRADPHACWIANKVTAHGGGARALGGRPLSYYCD